MNRYLVSQTERSNTESENIGTTRFHKKFGDAVYESVDTDHDETQYDQLINVNTTQNTAISMQENPAYEMNKTKTTT